MRENYFSVLSIGLSISGCGLLLDGDQSKIVDLV